MNGRLAVLVSVLSLVLPALAQATPALVLRETAWEPVEGSRVSSVSRVTVTDVLALRAIEVRIREPLTPGENVALQCPKPADGVTLFPPKRFVNPSTLVFALVFPDVPARGSELALSELGELRCIAGRAAGDPAVTAQAILRDGDRVDLPVSYVRSLARAPSGPSGLLLAPNPTAGSMEVRYRVDVSGRVEVGVFDLGGRRIRNLFTGVQEPGERTLRWDGRDDLQRTAPLGVYFIKVQMSGTTKSEHFVLMR